MRWLEEGRGVVGSGLAGALPSCPLRCRLACPFVCQHASLRHHHLPHDASLSHLFAPVLVCSSVFGRSKHRHRRSRTHTETQTHTEGRMHAHTPGEESAKRHARATRQWQRSCLSRRCAPSAAAHVLLPRCMLVRIRTTAVSTPALHPTTGTPRAVRLFSAASLPTLLPTPLPGSAAHARRKGQRILPPTPCLAAPHARPAWPRPAEGAHRQLDPPQGLCKCRPVPM